MKIILLIVVILLALEATAVADRVGGLVGEVQIAAERASAAAGTQTVAVPLTENSGCVHGKAVGNKHCVAAVVDPTPTLPPIPTLPIVTLPPLPTATLLPTLSPRPTLPPPLSCLPLPLLPTCPPPTPVPTTEAGSTSPVVTASARPASGQPSASPNATATPVNVTASPTPSASASIAAIVETPSGPLGSVGPFGLPLYVIAMSLSFLAALSLIGASLLATPRARR